MAGYLALRRYGKAVLLTLIVLASVGSVVWYARLDRAHTGGEFPPVSPQMKSAAQMVTRDFRHVETRMGRIMWILEASVAEIFANKAKLQNVKITYYGDRTLPITITGRKGHIDLRYWDAILTGDVRADRDDGAYLETQELRWKNQKRTLKAPYSVTIKSADMDISGEKMRADIDGGRVVFDGGVTTLLRLPADYDKPSS